MATKIVHVNTNIIRSNAKHGTKIPPLTVRGPTRSQPIAYGHEVDLVLNGEVVGTFVYSPDCPLDCGARVWFSSDRLEAVPRLWNSQEEKNNEQ